MSEPNTPDEQPTEQHQQPVAGPDAHQQPPAAEPPTAPQQPQAQEPQAQEPQATYAPPQPGAPQPQPQVIYVQKPPGKFANFARNRVTQVVAALVVGLIVGGGIGGIIGAHHSGGPGIHRPYSQYGPKGGFGRGGGGFGPGGPQQGTQQGEQG